MNCPRPLSLLCCGLLLCAAGCALTDEDPRTITIRPDQRYIDYEQEFQDAFAAPAPDGGYDLIMSAGAETSSIRHGERLYPATSTPVSHVVVIHVAWRPSSAASGDYPAAANSTVDWYAFDSRNDGVYTHYKGVGFVRVALGERETSFDLRDVRIKPAAISPSMKDPIGSSRLSGIIQARNDAPQAKLIAEEVSRRLQFASTAAPAATAPTTQP